MESDFYCDVILKEKIPIKKIMETENVLAYHHTKPSWPVHIIVISKHHLDSLISLIDGENKILLEMMAVLKQVIEKVQKEHGGCRLTTNFGKFQNTKHLHWHVYVGETMS